MVSIPVRLKPLFWDVSWEELSADRSAHFIISRLMEHGDELALRFLFRTYSRDELRDVLMTTRSVFRRSWQFWALILDVKEKVCTVKRYPTPFGECW